MRASERQRASGQQRPAWPGNAVDGGGVNAVEVLAVTKTFNAGTPKQVDALVDIDLTVASGEFVSLIGPSGCGKSTLLRLIANLTEPTSGSIVVNGKPAHQARIDQDYGMAFQQAGLFDWRTVVRNVELPLELKGWDRVQTPPTGDGDAPARQARRVRRSSTVATIRRDAAARGDCQSVGRRPGAAVDGRAVRGARRDDPRAHAGRAAADQRRGRQQASCS